MNRDTSNLVSGRGYGFFTWADLFTPRQLVALTTFSDLVTEAQARVERDAIVAGLPDDSTPLRDGGTGAMAYSEAVGVYLAFALDKVADRWSTICALGMLDTRRKVESQYVWADKRFLWTWDFAEANPLSSGSTGNCQISHRWWIGSRISLMVARHAAMEAVHKGCSRCRDSSQDQSADKVVSTDPPYYDNIGYADLSDFFYVWLRRSLRPVFPDLFATLAVPKAEELVATPYRHGNKKKAEAFFLAGMTDAMRRLAEQAHSGFPVTIYYAFKQSEKKGDEGTSSTGWETFLDAVIEAGFSITGTWPMRTELGNRMIGMGTNALASSIVLVCRRALRTPRWPPAASSLRPSNLNCRWPWPISSAATSRRLTSRRRPSARAWRSTPATPRCSTLRARPSRCAKRWS